MRVLRRCFHFCRAYGLRAIHILTVGDVCMKKPTWKNYLFWILLSEAVGFLSGWLSREATAYFQSNVLQPPLSPPAFLFPIVWGILYALMGIGAARINMSSPSAQRSRGLNLFILQLAVNFCWSIIFFNFQAYGFAFFWLMLLLSLVILMFFSFLRVDKTAGLLQIPYLIWLIFAVYLNFGVWYLNR